MDITKQLSNELLRQDFPEKQASPNELNIYKEIARHYAYMENAIAVLSDMHSNVSYIYYGGFAKTLGIKDLEQDQQLHSIWEENILKLIHPDDLHNKYLQELQFFHFIKRQAQEKRRNYYLANKIRMRNTSSGHYLPVLHRLFYIPISSLAANSMWLALCLYNPLLADIPNGTIINSVTGQTMSIQSNDKTKILTEREKQVLILIAQGMLSKNIAETLSISKNTVNRHRQDILKKLQVGNSIEACRIAKDLRII